MPIMTGYKTVFLDTNILIYHTFKDFDVDKHRYTRKLLEYLSKKNFEIFISSQVLREFFAIATNDRFFEKALTVEEAVSKLDEFKENFRVLFEDNHSIEILTRIVKKYKICKQDIHDANIAAVMMAHDIKKISTFDQKDFKSFEEIDLFEI